MVDYRLDISHEDLKDLIMQEAIRRDPTIASRQDLEVNFRWGSPMDAITASVDTPAPPKIPVKNWVTKVKEYIRNLIKGEHNATRNSSPGGR